jgi:hypothetical protein
MSSSSSSSSCCVPAVHHIGGPFAHALFTGTALGALFRTLTLSIGSYLSALLSSLSIPFLSTVPTLALSCPSTYAVIGLAGTIAAFFK